VTSSAFGYSTTNENGGCWGWFVKERTVGSIYLRNTYFPEYMYAADYGASGDTNPVYTWRPGNRVSQGHWIFEDLAHPKYKTDIRSVSSRNYLNGRNTNQVGLNQIHLTAPLPPYHKDEVYFKWELIKLNVETYNIKSYTSNTYLGGGTAVSLAHLTSDAARTNSSYKWRITKYTYNGRTRYAIQSLTSKRYLDGRNPGHQGGGTLFLTSRNPQNDRYLMWEIDEKAL